MSDGISFCIWLVVTDGGRRENKINDFDGGCGFGCYQVTMMMMMMMMAITDLITMATTRMMKILNVGVDANDNNVHDAHCDCYREWQCCGC